MKKILLFIIIFLFSFSNIFAISEFEVSNADPNTKVYIPEGFDILRHSMYYQSNPKDLDIETKTPLLLIKLRKVFKDKLHVIGEDYKKQRFSTDAKVGTGQALHISHTIRFDSKNPSILKWYHMNYLNGMWYDVLNIDKLRDENYSQFPQIFIFDDILLPQNITGTLVYSKEENPKLGKTRIKELNLSKKYELIKLKISKPIENYIYVLVPYYEIKIEESEINEGRIGLYYDIITEFPFSIYYSTSMRLYDKNGPNTPVVEYIKY